MAWWKTRVRVAGTVKQIEATRNDEFWSTKMADNQQHFHYINKLPYFREMYGKSKL